MHDSNVIQPSVLKHFHVVQEPNNNKKYIVKCKYCGIKIIGYTNTSSNCLRHIKNHHNAITSNGLSSKVRKTSQTANKYAVNDAHQQILIEALVQFIIEDLMPLSIVDSAAFNHLLDLLDPCFKVPSRKLLTTRLIDEKYTHVHDSVVIKLNDAESIHL